MTIIIYYTQDKKNFQVIRPQMTGENHFRGDVRKLVEHITKSDYEHNPIIKNYHHFDII